MARVFLPVLGIICLILGTNTHAVEWSALVKDLTKSVIAIQHGDDGVACSAFIINERAKDKDDRDIDYALTASHCDNAKLWADQSEAKVVSKTKDKDLMVLSVEDTGRPALRLATEDPQIGQEVASLGFGLGLEKPLFRVTHISAKTIIPYEGIGGPIFFTDASFVGGQSGGVVVNASGEVVMIVQMHVGSVIGLGVGAETIRDKTGKYWGKPQAKP